jgi:dolichyl-phosphate-mannose--protein O-mannosyl transferase
MEMQLGIISISTLLFFIAPFSILAVCAWMNVVPPQSLVIGIFARFSTIINMLSMRQKEMRHEMWFKQSDYIIV